MKEKIHLLQKKGQGKTLINKTIYKHYNKTMSPPPPLGDDKG
jgi:hypothetical protein